MNMHLQGGVAVGARPNAGIDVSKQHLDVCVGTEARRVANNAPGWDELTAMLQAADVDLVVIEATGGYDRGLVCALQGAGLAVARVNPRQARDFAKSMGVLAKTDQVDARTLREFADVLSRHEQRARYITPMLEQARADLAELMTRRHQLVDMRVAEHNRLEQAGPVAARSIRSVIKLLDKQLAALDANIDDHMNRHFGKQARVARQRQRRRAGDDPDHDGNAARAGPAQASANCQAGGRDTVGRQLRQPARQAPHMGRSRTCARGAVHGRGRGHAPQPGDPRVLRAAVGRGQNPRRWPSWHACASC